MSVDPCLDSLGGVRVDPCLDSLGGVRVGERWVAQLMRVEAS